MAWKEEEENTFNELELWVLSLDSVDRRQRKWETERYMGKIKRDGNKRETFVNPLLSLEISTVFYQRWTALVDKKISEAIAE